MVEEAGADTATYAFAKALGLEHNERLAFTVLHTLVYGGWVLILNLFFWACYHWQLFPKQRIRLFDPWPSSSLVLKAVGHTALSHIITTPLGLYFIIFPLAKMRGMETFAPMPPLHITVGHLLVSIVLDDTLFYWLHRLMHHRRLYKYFHKQHHEFRQSVGIAVEYAHPVDYIFSNIIPFYAGPFLLGSPLSFIVFWSILRVWETTETHSGYAFSWSPWNQLQSLQGGTARHDYHHSHNVGSYGAMLNVWDRVMGTDKQFRAFLEKQGRKSMAKAH